MASPAPAVDIEPALAREGLAGRRIGPHVPIRHGLLRTAEHARSVGASVIQVFTGDPKAWAAPAAPLADIDRFRALLDAWDIRLVVHASYLVNLASPDPAVQARGIERMRREMAAAADLGADAVVAHVGSHRGAGVATGVEHAAEAIARILEPIPGTDGGTPAPRLVLEVSAGQGDSLGVTVDEIAAIVEAAGRRGIDAGRLGVCLDTAHLWAAGYAVDEPVAIDTLLADVDAAMGTDALAMVHLNDNRAGRGSRLDRHEHLGDGRIGTIGLGHLVRHPRLVRVPMLLETPDLESGWDAVDQGRVRAFLGAGWVESGVADASAVVPATDGGGARVHIPGSAPERA
ncbi:MAG: deoxyribonuclease IV [Candidatus Limnocylindrales bacterium]